MNARLSTLVAGGLLLFGLVALVGIIALAALGQQVPGVLENLASGALGAFAALLARVGGADEVRVVNTPAQPVPVDPAAGHADPVLVAVVTAVILIVLLVAVGVIRA